MASIYDWSLTAADNATADSGLTWAEGQVPSTVNNSARVMMERIAELLGDIGGALAAGGTANGITVTANSDFTTYANGRMIAFKAAADNTGAVTLNVNSIGAKTVRKMDTSGDVALVSGDIKQNGVYVARYNTSLNGGAGGWQLINPPILPTGTSGHVIGYLDGANTWSAAQTIGSAVYTEYSGGDIASVVGGATSIGSLIQGRSSGHMVVGLRENGTDDSFAIISGGGNWTTDETYDTLIAKFNANGTTSLGGAVTVSGSVTASSFSTSGTATAASFSGSGSSLTNLNASNISSGTLSVSRLDSSVWRDGNTPSGSQITALLTGGTGISASSGTISVTSDVWRDGNQPSTSQINSIVSSSSVGGVGTYAFLRNDGSADVSPGNTASGGNLTYATAAGTATGANPSGTWRCMGFAKGTSSGASAAERTSLFIRT